MALSESIDIFKVLDWIRDAAPIYAKAKADRVYLEEWRRSKKAILMKSFEKDFPSAVSQEREALAHPEYIAVLDALRVATEEEETLRWRIVAAQAKIAAWQTLEATRRLEMKVVP